MINNFIEDAYSVVDVVGIGATGSHAINHLIGQDVGNINSIVIDSDKHILDDLKSNCIKSLSNFSKDDNDEIFKRQLTKMQEKMRKLLTSEFAIIIVLDIQDLNSVLCAEMVVNIAKEQFNHAIAVLYNSLPTGENKRVQTSTNKLNKIFDTVIVTSNTRLSNSMDPQVTTDIHSLEKHQLFFSLHSLLSVLQYDFYANFRHGIDHHDVLSIFGAHNNFLADDKVAVPVTISSAVTSKGEEIFIAFQRAIAKLSFSLSGSYCGLVIITTNRDYSLEEYEQMKEALCNCNHYDLLIEIYDITPSKNHQEEQVTILSAKNKLK